jgi:hypothetical protein
MGAPLYKGPVLARRIAAWLLTGPLGHLVAGVADWAELLGRWWLGRLRAAHRK